MPETDETPTPLWKLSEHFKAISRDAADARAYQSASMWKRAAVLLERSLAAYNVDAALKEIRQAFRVEYPDTLVVDEERIAAALRAAAAIAPAGEGQPDNMR